MAVLGLCLVVVIVLAVLRWGRSYVHAARAPRVRITTISEAQASSVIGALLSRATDKPLDDFATRIVMNAMGRTAVIDVPIFAFSGAQKAHAGLLQRWKIRRLAGLAIFHALSAQSPHQDFIGHLALAYFEPTFLPTANRGRTSATACNTLVLEIAASRRILRVTRFACHRDYPTAPIDLGGGPHGLLAGLFGQLP